MRNVPQFYASNDQRVDAFEYTDLYHAVETSDMLKEAERIMYDAWRANGREDA